MNKVVLVGMGNVGASYAYSLINQKTSIDELVLIDINKDKVLGDLLDLNHGLVLTESKIKLKHGDYSDCVDADIVIIAAGANQKENETRLDLLNKNSKIVKEITENVVKSGFKGIFLIATNPVDIMTYVVRKYSNFSSNKVIGTGTMLDTARLKYYLSQRLRINSNNINAYVLGEHGDSSFVLWSKIDAGVISINNLLTKDDKEIIETEVQRAAYKIINYKGETSFAVAECLVKLTEAILNDENVIYPISAPVNDIYIGMPAVINKNGIKGVIKVNFTKEEEEKYNKSYKIIKDTISKMEE